MSVVSKVSICNTTRAIIAQNLIACASNATWIPSCTTTDKVITIQSNIKSATNAKTAIFMIQINKPVVSARRECTITVPIVRSVLLNSKIVVLAPMAHVLLVNLDTLLILMAYVLAVLLTLENSVRSAIQVITTCNTITSVHPALDAWPVTISTTPIIQTTSAPNACTGNTRMPMALVITV